MSPTIARIRPTLISVIALDRQAVERSFNDIVMRHEVLRSTFESAVGDPVQIIAARPDKTLLKAEIAGIGTPFAMSSAAWVCRRSCGVATTPAALHAGCHTP